MYKTTTLTVPLVSTALGYYVGKKLPGAKKAWTAFTAVRTTKTSSMLSNIKAIKMIGLEDVMTQHVQGLRDTELNYSLKSLE